MKRKKESTLNAVVFALVVALLCVPIADAQNTASPTPIVGHAVAFAVSGPLRDLAKLPSHPYYNFHQGEPMHSTPKLHAGMVHDTIEQNSPGAPSVYSIGANFLGVGYGFPGYTLEGRPPDTEMAVGDTQIVDWINFSYAVLDKSGNALLGPIDGNLLWQALGGVCYNNNSGDPIAQWDRVDKRWLLVQNVFAGPPYYACVAISQTSDATGSYYLYQFPMGNGFPDYPKWGIWPSGYFQTINNQGPGRNGFVGAVACAYNTAKLLVGDQTAEQICFQLTTLDSNLLPADVDSAVPPPANEDEVFIGSLGSVDNSHLSLYSMHPVFANPQQSTFTGSGSSQLMPIPSFNPACNGDYSGDCAPQLNGPDLEVAGDRLMYRLAYWDDTPTANVTAVPPIPLPQQHWYLMHDVQASGGNVAERWYEVIAPHRAVPVTSLSVFQSGTFSPDSNYRWMGSIARDKAYDILMGYSVSSASLYPSVFVTGRTLNDPLGTMESEQSIVNGAGAQQDESQRWGDYSAMRLDPDGCRFWYTQEYYMFTSNYDWSTRIASVKFPNCH